MKFGAISPTSNPSLLTIISDVYRLLRCSREFKDLRVRSKLHGFKYRYRHPEDIAEISRYNLLELSSGGLLLSGSNFSFSMIILIFTDFRPTEFKGLRVYPKLQDFKYRHRPDRVNRISIFNTKYVISTFRGMDTRKIFNTALDRFRIQEDPD